MIAVKYIKTDHVKIPVLGLGTAGTKEERGKEAIKHALKIGYRHIDTAQMYGNEREVGKAISEDSVDRDDVFITTKIDNPNHRYEDVIESVEQSLERLRTDYVDLLLIHWPVENVPLKDTLDGMNHLKKQGKVKNIGVSNFTVQLMEKAQKKADAPIVCNQVEYHPFLSQEDVLTYCRNHDIILTAYSPLAQGKVIKNDVLKAIGKKYGKTPAQITLRWHVQQPNVIAIPRSESKQHQRENLDIFNFHLKKEEMQRISDLEIGERIINPKSAPWH